MSADEAEELAARLGHPTHDPRGQPIPTADGAMPPLADLSLYALDVGESVEVVRLVDQSPEVLEGLERRGIGLGTRLEVVGRSESTLTVHTGTEPVVLGHLAAAAVAVRRTPKEVEPASPVTLSEIPIGGTARVTRISPACQGPQRRRFMDLGVVPGTEVSPEFESGAGDPVAYRISGALIALRRVQARWIEVEPVQKGDAA